MSLIQQILQSLQLENQQSCVASQLGPSIKACPSFNASSYAANLDKAIKAKGVDEATIIDLLTKIDNSQRQQLKPAYQQTTGKPLEEALKKALSGHLEEVVLSLMKTPAQFDAQELKWATKGLGTDEDCLVQMLVPKSNKEIKEMKRAYTEAFKEDIAKNISGDTAGDFQKALLILAKGERSEDPSVNEELADRDARALYEAGEKRKGTDVATFTDILTTRSFPHLRKVFQMYGKYSKHDLNKALDLELKGDIENCLISIVKCAVSKPAYFAEKLYLAMKGSGTHDKALIRTMVSRAEIDMNDIKAQYKKLYGKSLRQAILDETKGDYETILLALCGPDN
ncbi:annexin A1-like [Rhinatrema bivittatum]|uniref:annexin A1-like n=1 Tax=Rhinatrema bivittatum TaxID=194408 RepID=UPI00112A278C|nr:annexin A1-like [Rhinatrema bivittatum]